MDGVQATIDADPQGPQGTAGVKGCLSGVNSSGAYARLHMAWRDMCNVVARLYATVVNNVNVYSDTVPHRPDDGSGNE